MNAITALDAIHFLRPHAAIAGNATTSVDASQAPAAIRAAPRYREREFGVGYGTSSGYASASARRYVETGFQPYFRCG